MLIYVKTKLNLPKNKYKVLVKDRVNADGSYCVEAYTKYQAQEICRKQHNIKLSWKGTEFEVTQI